METNFYPSWYKLNMTQSTNQIQFYATRDIHVINSTPLDRRGIAWKRMCVSQKLRCKMHQRYCNVASRTTYRSDFPVCGSVEAVQELHEVPEQVMYKRSTCMTGMPVKKPKCFQFLCGRTEFHMVGLGRKLYILCVVSV